LTDPGRLRIGIASAGRFHVLNLARELHQLGHEVRFYSYVPKSRGRRFGLPDSCQSPVAAAVSPLLVWQQLAPRFRPDVREHLLHLGLDRAVAARLEPCDVFVFMSGIFLEAARQAKRRFGARLWLERGSAHIDIQDRILAAIPGAERPSPESRARELSGYELADRIVVPSRFTEASFAPTPERAKLFRNPYGVQLDDFPLVAQRPQGHPLRLLFVGAWSSRKGCDLLTATIKASSDVILTHVGGVADLPFPGADPRFRHVGPVDQLRLREFYAQADALILASREEGLSIVQAQALASGLPVICTDRTGGADLGHTPALAERILVAPSDDAAALAGTVNALRERLGRGQPFAPLTDLDRKTLSWRAYGERYSAELIADVEGARSPRDAP
jgi:glycosyltransferase involved in cell wall biosynthesis